MQATPLAALGAAILFAGGAALAQQQQMPPQAQPEPISEEARQCLADLQAFNEQLVQAGYGFVGPEGYMGAPGWRPYGAITTPRGEMRTLTNAAYILALSDNAEGCSAVVQEMTELYERRRGQLAEGYATPREGLADWRIRRLQAAIPVSELDRPVRADEILGADVRNLRDAPLGDVEDIILGADGEIEYVLIRRGGFFGFGGTTVPVRWQDLRVTLEPHRDTLVLPIEEAALELAPTVDNLQQDFGPEWRQQVDAFWDERMRG